MIKIDNIQSRQLLMMTLFLKGLRQRATSLTQSSSKIAIENESPGERLEAGTDKVTREVQQEVAAAEERIGAGTDKVVEEARQEVAAARRPWYQTKKWGSVLLIIYAALLVVFGLLAWFVASHPILAIDIKIT